MQLESILVFNLFRSSAFAERQEIAKITQVFNGIAKYEERSHYEIV